MQRVAFFDIDGTVFRSSLLIELIERLVEEGHFDSSVRNEYKTAFTAWQNREGTYENYIDAVVRAYIHNVKGLHYGMVADSGRVVVAEQGRRVYRYTRDLIKELKQKGYMVVAISQSPKTVLDVFCKDYGFDKVYGRMYEIGPTDCFTGTIIDEHLIANKANIVNRVFANNAELSREDSIAVGDTEGDISLLESVHRPICFNPNRALYDQALARGWEVVVERKDVIYHL